ncbi:MAG: type II toxin-antitoxin system VapC family toxin [Opitutales bacterium]|nr:type II toxin-antitoxin system VapC family toxin [Opitutales bacterium]
MAGGLPVILLDTCGLLALQTGGEALSETARAQLEAPGSEVFVSAISAFEIGQKHGAGKLILQQPPGVWFFAMLQHHQLVELPVTARICAAATALPAIHKDPFDRIIIATALEKHLVILTSDKTIPTYPGIRVLW